jgi:hypothetical protein
MLNLPAAILKEAHRRETADRPQHGKLRDDSHTIGMEGEYLFSTVFDLPMNLDRKDQGDGGIDFWLPTSLGTFPVDVKTATHAPPWLLVEVADCDPMTIYVLASFIKGKTKLEGWQWGKFVAKGEQGVFTKDGPYDYRLLPNELRDIFDLVLAKI